MSDKATEPAPAPTDPAGTTPAEPTLDEKLGGLTDPNPEPSHDDRIEKMLQATEKRTKDLQRIISKLGEEKKALQEKVEASGSDYGGAAEDDWEAALIKKVEARVREGVKADVEPMLQPFRNQAATQAVVGSSDLAKELLSDQTTVAWLKEQAADEEAMAALVEDKSALLMKATLFDAVERKYKAQQGARKNAPPVVKPEEGGMVSPPGGESAAPAKDTFEDKAARGEVDPSEARKKFLEKAKALGF